ncbi:hypothetical protein [Pelomonas aquatica]|uniref:hypothetical protein n=1 Tax=Pelomonas aquatica TaxID=431058 RepID=UPI00286AD7A7|nr:hypothetical protein [Pelomonas aquatica]
MQAGFAISAPLARRGNTSKQQLDRVRAIVDGIAGAGRPLLPYSGCGTDPLIVWIQACGVSKMRAAYRHNAIAADARP